SRQRARALQAAEGVRVRRPHRAHALGQARLPLGQGNGAGGAGTLTTAPTPLGRYRLLDLSRQLPGPFCSTVLGDLGMDVLVVTNPKDPFGPGIPFLSRNKRSMT